ncbi:MAG TPA: TfoX/Sxy family protein [Steroidobacteraceae bacterium]|jgi:TfoX/Sxy family transcriptional regulator of competence genes|nr:TfoX/Sxy family protein [Steroidobacteraceae bacterium]
MMSAEKLAESVRSALADQGAVREVKMFGGIGFMLNGNLIAGASRRGLLARVGAARGKQALARPGARPMRMRGRTLEGWIYVDRDALTPRAVDRLMDLALPYVLSLPRRARPAKRSAT